MTQIDITTVTTLRAQPIETAPRDGTDILVYSSGIWRPVRWGGWGGGVWMCLASGHNSVADDATHWLPMLPAPQ